jgi:hypothetical protein
MSNQKFHRLPVASYLVAMLIIGALTAALIPNTIVADGTGVDPFPGHESTPPDSSDTTDGAQQSPDSEGNVSLTWDLYALLLSILL